MSKIICDVCGTSYPETATQCPICGCVRPADTVTVNAENTADEMPTQGTYTYVKGGRFSKANVKKRNGGNHPVLTDPVLQDEPSDEKTKKSDKGLTITICVLLLVIIAVVIYIAMHFFAPGFGRTDPTDKPLNNTAGTTTANTTEEPTQEDIPCVDMIISNTIVELDKVGAAHLLNVTTDPEDTTDEIQFVSSDETVATVTAGGKIVAVGPGQAVITVSCGDAEAQCRVVCTFESIPDETTEPTTEPPVSAEDFKLNREDFTMSVKGETWLLYKGDIPVKQITWTSDNEKVATIKDGVVTAVGTGNTTVYGEYNGQKVSCIVRCGPGVGKYVETSSDTQEPVSGKYSTSSTDVTLKLISSKSFELKLLDSENKPVDVIWSVEDATVCSVSGNTVTALKVGETKVFVMYEGEPYECIVRVVNG